MPGKKYPFIISNTDRSDQGNTDWWSILNISLKKGLLFFDSFGIRDMRHFIVSNDKKIVEKVLKGLVLADQRDYKLTRNVKIFDAFIWKTDWKWNRTSSQRIHKTCFILYIVLGRTKTLEMHGCLKTPYKTQTFNTVTCRQ